MSEGGTPSTTARPAPKTRLRRRDKIALSAFAISAVLVIGSWFVDMGSPLSPTGAALCTLVAAGTGIVFGRHRMRAIFRAPLVGLFYGLVTVIVLGAILVGFEWLMPHGRPVASLEAIRMVGLPAGAVIGVGIGLIAWMVFRLIPARAPGTDAQRKRWRLQFSLRTMLFGILVVALLLGIGMPSQRNYQRQRTVSQLLEHGARIEFEKEKPGEWLEEMVGDRLGPRWLADVRRVELGEKARDEDLPLLEHIGELKSLALIRPQVSDAGLAYLPPLHALESLYLECPQLTREGASFLARLPKLNYLWLRHVTIAGDGRSQLPPLPIRTLEFHLVNITDADLPYLAGLPALMQLTLSGTGVTDAGLARLARCQTLRGLVLDGGRFTGKALSQLAGIPNLVALTLESMSIQDKDLRALTAIPNLQTIQLRRTPITDAGLALLEALPMLRQVSLESTSATKAGIDKLRAVLQAKNPPGYVSDL